jgi:hypothetical protein
VHLEGANGGVKIECGVSEVKGLLDGGRRSDVADAGGAGCADGPDTIGLRAELRARVENINFRGGLEAFGPGERERGLAVRVHPANGGLDARREQGHVDRVIRPEVGLEGLVAVPTEEICGVEIEFKEMPADGRSQKGDWPVWSM